jgi:hypothetical protein
MCDHVWIFEAKDAEHAASPATMRHVRCIPDGTKVPRTGHIDMRTSGWRTGGLRVVPAGRHGIAASRRDVMVPRPVLSLP